MLKINGKDNLGNDKCFEENNQGEVLANYLVMMVIEPMLSVWGPVKYSGDGSCLLW